MSLIFSKIEYLNLLPFNVFAKRYTSDRFNKIANYKSSYPSKINQKFKNRKIDGAFISSIHSKKCVRFKKCRCSDIGIVASKEVLSVLIKFSQNLTKDPQSDTSNMLANILDANGQVVIGDRALKIYFNTNFEKEKFGDLAQMWYDRFGVPFVFARLCYTSHFNFYDDIARRFKDKKIFVPHYILKKESSRVGISIQEAKYYLSKIEYSLNYKAKKSLKLFIKLSKKQ